jgi:hypothetical protein
MNWVAPLLAAVVLFYSPIHANIISSVDYCELDLSAEVSGARKRVEENHFITDRKFADYEELLGSRALPSLGRTIDELPKGSVWLDLGAGQALAQRQFLYRHDGGNGLNLVAVSYDAPEDSALAADRADYASSFRFIESGFIEEAMANPAHPIQLMRGQVDFLTEVWGPTSYMRDINKGFEIVADLLKVGGRARILMGQQTRYFRDHQNLAQEEGAKEICFAGGQRLKLIAGGQRYNKVQFVGVFEKVSEAKQPCYSFSLSHFVNDGPPIRYYSVP